MAVEFGASPLGSLLLPFSSYPVVASPDAGGQCALPISLPDLLLKHSCQCHPPKGSEHGGLPRSLWGSRSLLFLCPGGLKAPALKRCLCLQKALAALALSLLGAAGGGAAAEQMVPVGGFGGLLAGRLGGGSPFTARLGEGSLASHMVRSQLSASMGLCCYSSN